jgi:hypothetical protein
VIEFGLVGQTMHQIDERTPVSDLEKLTEDLSRVLDRFILRLCTWRHRPRRRTIQYAGPLTSRSLRRSY